MPSGPRPATRRITMRKIKEVLRLRYACGLSLEQIARAQNLSKGVVAKYLKRATAAGIDGVVAQTLSEADLVERLKPQNDTPRQSSFTAPDFAHIHQALKHKSVTLQMLWEDYRDQCPGRAYRYTSFCVQYRAFAKGLKRSMALGHPVRQVHRAGEKLFVDYAGQTLSVIDPASGEIRRAQVFVAVLGASNYTYAEATWTQTAADWLGAHCRALAYFGGCPEVVVPDNARALIADPDRYEPALGRAYQEWAAHYGCAVIPARPYRPQDKAKVEVGVQVVERWILARLRTRQCFSLAEVNAAMAALLTELNRRPFKKLPGNGPRPPGRASAFAALDQPALRALPATVFELARWKKARVSIDYHVDIERHYYSVPHQLVGQLIEVRITACMIECLHQGKRVASHVRSHLPGRHTTQAEHMPKSHRAHLEWTPGRLLNWALSIGPATRDIAQYQLESKPHPEMGYRACLGLMRLARQYNPTRLESACRRALALRAPTYRSVASILKAGLDQQPLPTSIQTELHLPAHPNVRGSKYYH